MFTAPTPAPPSVAATAPPTATPSSPRPTGLHRGITFLRSLHLHSPTLSPDDARETPKTRPRAATHTPPASPAAFPPSSSSSHVLAVAIASPPTLSRRVTADGPLPRPSTDSPPASPSPDASMTRSRAEATAPPLTVRNTSGPTPAMTTPTQATVDPSESGADAAGAARHLPSIRFIPHQDPRAGRPSLQFPTITRTLPDESAIIRVGRYSERDSLPEIPSHAPSAAAVGFKSKVVSRKHCELWCKDGSWYIKDVKSSSGTFLNHIRLSQPNVESKPFRIKDGDIIQLGIDFRGGEEMIFRCVKIRVECNRGWQQGLNNFNKQTHQRLRNLAKSKKEGDSASTHTSECAICLMSIAPCQSLFVAPCSHVWHYKCIRPILNGPTWPNFLCPNCRAVADLEEDVEEPDLDDWEEDAEQVDGEPMAKVETQQGDRQTTPPVSGSPVNGNSSEDAAANLAHLISNINVTDSLDEIASQPLPETPDRRLTPPATSSVTQPVAINVPGANEYSGLSPLHPAAIHNGLMPDRAPDGPMTPRNDVGPFVLDGSAGRAAGNCLRDDSSDSSSSGGGVPTLPPVRFE
ncbi:hypothetical protein J1614_003092 [Plenodomus biglobosus]|nr:hypothetical protein J1614_003092 [Plenodomus biglobosus]